MWKRLLGQELTRGDMEAVDTLTCRLLDSVRACATPEEFDAKFGGSLTFVVTGHDGCVLAGIVYVDCLARARNGGGLTD